MTWVRQTADQSLKAPCFLPSVTEFGDLWRCDECRELWRVGNDCDACDPFPPDGRCVRGGYHPRGLAWRPATWWQRLRNWKKATE